MATKSVYKSIDLNSKKTCRSLLHLLEHPEKFKGKEVQFKRKPIDVKGDMIGKVFGE